MLNPHAFAGDPFFPSLDTASIKVLSIQWLSRHYREMKEPPSLIVIDEAHHALAETYAEVMNAYPKAKKLGLTATPYRMEPISLNNAKNGKKDNYKTYLRNLLDKKYGLNGKKAVYNKSHKWLCRFYK